MIPEEALKAAAKEVYYTSGRYRSMPYAVAIKACESEAMKILTAAAPFLRAQALEDAADELARLPYVKPGAEGRDEYERMLAIRRGNTDAWLKARAVTERGGE